MSKFLKVCICLCVVGVLCAPSFGQAVRMYWEPDGGTSNAVDASQDTVIYAGQGDQVCVNIKLEGIGGDFDSAAVQATADDGASATVSGGIQADCTTVAVVTGDANACSGSANGEWSLNTTSVNNCGASGTGDKMGWLRGFATPGFFATIDDGGCYMAEVCFDVSADMCGDATITFQGTPDFNTIITDENQVAQLDAIFDDLIIRVAPLNDACADATAVGSATYAYDSTCATADGAGCDGTTGDIWFEYTADCTGEFSVTADDGTATAHTSCATQDGTCGVTDLVVSDGQTVVVQLTGATSGNITFTCEPFCTDGLDPDDPITLTECGDDGDPCTAAFCEAGVGCTIIPYHDGNPCDDGLFCTINDACDAGTCVGPDPLDCNDGAVCTVDTCDDGIDSCVNTDINSIPCTDIGDCPVVAESCTAGFCVCVENPPLCLNASEIPAPASLGACFDEDTAFQVTVDLGFATTPICAAQFYLSYDTSMLDFVSIVPGGGVFNTVIHEFVDEGAGTIDYLVGENPGKLCTGQSEGLVAVLTFLPIGECKSTGVCFRGHNPPTRLGGIDGSEVCPLGHVRPDGSCGLLDNPAADPCCTGPLNFDSTDPVITCPNVVTFGNADCGTVTRDVTWAPITATDNCDGDLPVNCAISHNAGLDVSGLLAGGGTFPPGVTTISCAATVDSCGNSADCDFTVVNSGQNGLHVDVELSATMAAGPLLRGIEFEVSDCGAANPIIETGCADVTFGFPWHVPGHGEFQAKLPPGNYYCLEAWDPLHTLKSTCDVTCEDIEGKGSVWFASFKGSKDLSDTCHWLVNGNLNGLDLDGVGRIDILDYVTYLAAVLNNPIPGADTPCGTEGPHGDINGDGIVNLMDFSFILVNIFNSDKAGCDAVCNPSPDFTVAPPRESISVRELTGMGFGREARAADINGDGNVDLSDMALYLNGGEASRSVRGSR